MSSHTSCCEQHQRDFDGNIFFESRPLKRTIACATSPCFIWYSLRLHTGCKLISAWAAVAVVIENPFNVEWQSGAAHFGTSSQDTHKPSNRLIWAWGSLDSGAKGQREGKREKQRSWKPEWNLMYHTDLLSLHLCCFSQNTLESLPMTIAEKPKFLRSQRKKKKQRERLRCLNSRFQSTDLLSLGQRKALVGLFLYLHLDPRYSGAPRTENCNPSSKLPFYYLPCWCDKSGRTAWLTKFNFVPARLLGQYQNAAEI